MAWKTIDRNESLVDPDAGPLLSDAVVEKIQSLFPSYETKRAVLLPALHIVQDAVGHVPYQAMVEVAELLDLHPSQVMDTISFYTHFWTQPRGQKVIVACRSISCEVLGGAAVIDELKKQLGIDEHQTTGDGKYSLMTEECLAGCDHAPCLLINEKLHKRVRPEDVARILADPNNDRIDGPRSDLYDAPKAGARPPGRSDGNGRESSTTAAPQQQGASQHEQAAKVADANSKLAKPTDAKPTAAVPGDPKRKDARPPDGKPRDPD